MQPAGTPVLWTSSNEDVVTVNNGAVTAIDAGDAVVTAQITVDGVVLSDSCNVSVSEWELIRDLTSGPIWTDSDMWIEQIYTEDNRETYMDYKNGLSLVYNSAGDPSTIYTSLKCAVGNFRHTDGYEYAMKFVYDNSQAPDNAYNVNVQRTLSSNTLCSLSGQTNITIEGATGELVVPMEYNADKERLCTVQIKKIDPSTDGKCFLKIRVLGKMA